MQIAGAMHHGLQGMQTGITGVERNAADIASAERMNDTATTELHQPLVEQRQNLHQVGASANVIKAADAVLGTVIDMMA